MRERIREKKRGGKAKSEWVLKALDNIWSTVFQMLLKLFCEKSLK